MHASIALCLMMVGGPIAPGPGSDLILVPLKDDLSALNAMQELEWKVRVKNGYKLPRVPSVVDDTRSRDDGRGMNRRNNGLANDPNAQRRQQDKTMPFAPTDPGAGGQGGYGQAGYGQGGYGQGGYGQGGGAMPSTPGSGLGQGGTQGYSQGNNFGEGGFNNRSAGGSVSGYGTPGVPRSAYTPTASDYSRVNGYGGANVSPNPMLNTSVGGGDKPFAGYQRPSGYSPWMGLYNTPTNGGTVSPYSSTVQPAMQQQQYNQQVAEQIKDVRYGMVSPRSGTPGMEMPVNGAGLSNPYGSINYTNPMGNR
jgi:hypothetical protein